MRRKVTARKRSLIEVAGTRGAARAGRKAKILGEIFGTGFTPLSHIIDILISEFTHSLHTRVEHTKESWHKHLATCDNSSETCVRRISIFNNNTLENTILAIGARSACILIPVVSVVTHISRCDTHDRYVPNYVTVSRQITHSSDRTFKECTCEKLFIVDNCIDHK